MDQPQLAELHQKLVEMLELKVGRPIPEAEKQLIVGLTMDILQKDNTLDLKYIPEDKLDATLTAAGAAAQYFEMKLLEKECQHLIKKIADPSDPSNKEELADKLTDKLKQLHACAPEKKRNPNIAKDLADPNFAKTLLEKIQQGKFSLKKGDKDEEKTDSLNDGKKPSDADEPSRGKDFARETNELLLGISNPSMITGQPLIIYNVISNSSGIVDNRPDDKSDALYVDNEAGQDNKDTYTSPSPFSTTPKNPTGV